MQRKPSWWPPEVLRVQICPRIELQSRRSLDCATLALPGAVSLCTFLEHRPVGAPQWPLLFLPFLTQAPLGPAPPPSRCPCPAGSCCSGLGILSLKPTLIRPQEVSESVSHSIMSNSLIPRSCSSVHGILQARILEWIAFPYARGSSEPRDRTQGSRASCTGRKVPYCLDLIPESRGGNGMQPRFWCNVKQQTGSKSGKGYVKAVYCHPAYLTYMQSTSWGMPGWVNHKLEPRLPGGIAITSDMQIIPPLWQKAKN